MKKKIRLLLLACSSAFVVGCSSGKPVAFDAKNTISVVSREEGSGTRGAFIELFHIEEKRSDGSKVDHTTKEAIVANKTDVVMTNITSDRYAIGYLSLGSWNESVKALQVNGVSPTAETVIDGSYPVVRSFQIATKANHTELAKDFISFIMSADGQAIVSKNYIAINNEVSSYQGGTLSGKLVIAGSSSVTPVMEKLKEAYEGIHSNVTIELQQSDSTAGLLAVMNGTADIGMSSRDLKESELAVLTPVIMAMDGIVIVVNQDNPLNALSSAQITSIFTGETTHWNSLQ